jgi:hypothetical protein
MACSAFDGEALRAARRWLEGLGQRVWAIAPLEEMPLPEDMPPSKGEDAKIIEFLDWMQATRGERSVIYVRRVLLCPRRLSADPGMCRCRSAPCFIPKTPRR